MTMTQEEKLEEAKRLYKTANADQKYVLESLFPELIESKDVRIRKSLIILLQHFCKGYRVPGLDFPVSYKDMLAWLEKQGEQKTVDEIAKEVCKNKELAVVFLKSAGIINEKGELAEQYRQDEQKPTDKVEPKFKIGQTIKKEGFNLGFTIVKIKGNFYYNDVGDHFPFTDQDNWELVEKKSTWSEEDRDYYDAIIAKLEITQEDSLLTDNQMEFLKSLKERYTWKPSDEQMEGIECTIKTLRYQLNAGDNRLDSLYNDLKKLREK